MQNDFKNTVCGISVLRCACADNRLRAIGPPTGCKREREGEREKGKERENERGRGSERAREEEGGREARHIRSAGLLSPTTPKRLLTTELVVVLGNTAGESEAREKQQVTSPRSTRREASERQQVTSHWTTNGPCLTHQACASGGEERQSPGRRLLSLSLAHTHLSQGARARDRPPLQPSTLHPQPSTLHP